MSDGWIRISDELPPVQESFKDGTNYHGYVICFFPHYAKHKIRDAALWTHDGKERWQVSLTGGTSKPKEPPTHWRPQLSEPEHG